MRYKTLQGFSPVVGEMLLLKQKPTNCMDLSAVSYYLQRELSDITEDITVSAKRLQSKGFAEVTGPRVNRRAGYGLEIPCVYKLYGPKPYTASFHPFLAKPRLLCEGVASRGLRSLRA